MAEWIGRRGNLGVAREITRGTNPGTPDFWVQRTEMTFQDRVTKVVSGEAHGHIDDATDSYPTERFGQGTVGGEVRDDIIGIFFYALLGTIQTVDNTGDYTHTLTEENSNQHQSLTLFWDDPNNDDASFKLAMITSMSLSVETGQLATFSIDFESQPSDDSADLTSAYTSQNQFVSHFVNIRLASAVGGLGAATDLPIKSFTITFSKNTSRDHNFGTITPTEIHNQQFMVEGSFTLNNEDNTYRNYMRDNTYQALRLAMVNTDVTLGGSNNPTVQIDLSRCHFFDWDRNVALDEISGQTINFKGLSDITNSLNIVNEVVVINETASY